MAGLLFTPREGSTVASSSVAPAAYAGSGRHGIRVAAPTICHRGHRSARGGRRRAAASGLRVSLRVSVGSNVRRALSFVCINPEYDHPDEVALAETMKRATYVIGLTLACAYISVERKKCSGQLQ